MAKSKKAFENIWVWILAIVVLGTFWHFGYEIFGKNFLAGMVFPINESVWEHLKIVFFPLLIAGIIGYFSTKPRNPKIWLGTLVGTIVAMLIVFFGFYLYSSIIGESLLADILLYICAIIVGMYAAWWVGIYTKGAKMFATLAIIGLAVISAMLVYLTVRPPRWEPFIEQGSNTYGIDRTLAD